MRVRESRRPHMPTVKVMGLCSAECIKPGTLRIAVIQKEEKNMEERKEKIDEQDNEVIQGGDA